MPVIHRLAQRCEIFWNASRVQPYSRSRVTVGREGISRVPGGHSLRGERAGSKPGLSVNLPTLCGYVLQAFVRALGLQPCRTANTIPGDGTFLVGKDVKPGTYRMTGPKSGSSCYWQRSGDASGTNIIANDNIAGPAVVDIKSSDVAFKTSRCAAWTLAR